MFNGNNTPFAEKNEKVVIGRIRSKIKNGSKIYLISNKKLLASAKSSYLTAENRKIKLDAIIKLEKEKPITLTATTLYNPDSIYNNITVTEKSSVCPVKAINKPIDIERILTQLKKTNSTQFEFNHISVNLASDLFIPNISAINDIRRNALTEIEKVALTKLKRTSDFSFLDVSEAPIKNTNILGLEKNISICFNIINNKLNYTLLENFNNAYIPLKYFYNNSYEKSIKAISQKANIYIYLPVIIKSNFKNLLANYIKMAIEKYPIKGFVFSNIGNLDYLKYLSKKYNKNFDFIANYTLNVFNNYTIEALLNLGISTIEISPELNKDSILSLCKNHGTNLELFAYGNIPLMNANYCFLGKSNKCYPNCSKQCFNTSEKFYLEDRLGFNFRFIPDNIQTITTVFNSKITSIESKDFNVKSLRINLLNETIKDINYIIRSTKEGKRLEGKDYTNSNLNRTI